MKVTFEIDTNMTAEKIKALLIWQIESSEFCLENTIKDRTEIDADSVVVQEESK